MPMNDFQKLTVGLGITAAVITISFAAHQIVRKDACFVGPCGNLCATCPAKDTCSTYADMVAAGVI